MVTVACPQCGHEPTVDPRQKDIGWLKDQTGEPDDAIRGALNANDGHHLPALVDLRPGSDKAIGFYVRHARGWLEQWLLGDVRTLLWGVHERYWPPCAEERGLVNRYPPPGLDGRPMGGANYAAGILLCTAIEVLARYHTGDCRTDRPPKGCARYNAQRNVEELAAARLGPLADVVIAGWDSIRNGLSHTFATKPGASAGSSIWYHLDSRPEAVTHVCRSSKGSACVFVAVFELYESVRDAADAYFAQVSSDPDTLKGMLRAFEAAYGHAPTEVPGGARGQAAGRLMDKVASAPAFRVKDAQPLAKVPVPLSEFIDRHRW